MSELVYIGVGSNIDPESHIPMAIDRLRQQLDVKAISPFYKFPAMGTAVGQDDFINGMVLVETDLTPEFLKFNVLREIEYELGRNKDISKYSARKMDLDLILFGDQTITSLNVPEPEIRTRPYIYIPLLDLSPEIVLPREHVMLANQVEEMALNPNMVELK
ncbi:MAG: 2-amino-4-hydroxy-6-hydroxymethyldihydropteridine diphosphokinase [Lentisphaeraceae bacterium]|nr:2-amino-4-hydroxy-6-hydroxymethyldihydropteridine diphosphokinase [Lentisphaeraceae bacterium]